MRKSIISVFCLLLIGLYFFSTKNQKDANLFIVGTAGGYAPFVSLNEAGQYEGFDIDLAQELAKQMGKRLEIRDFGSMTPLFLALEQGDIDAIIWGLSIIPERLAKVAMVQYQGDTIKAYQLLFWQQIPEGVATIEGLKGKLVCVEVGSAQERVLSRYPEIVQKSMDKVIDALLEIQFGKADAAFVEPAVARKFQKKVSEIKILDVPLKKEDLELGTGIAIKKDNKELIERVQQAVAKLKQRGIVQHLEDKWRMQ